MFKMKFGNSIKTNDIRLSLDLSLSLCLFVCLCVFVCVCVHVYVLIDKTYSVLIVIILFCRQACRFVVY